MGVRRLLTLSAVVLTFVLSACGGDNDPSGEPPTTSPPEPADTRPTPPAQASFPPEFVEQVDPLCVEALDRVDEISAQQIDDQAALGQVANAYRDGATALEGLEPPEQNATAYGRFTDAFREAQRLVEEIDAEAGRGDSSVFQRVPGVLDEANTNIRDLATEYGFTECAATN